MKMLSKIAIVTLMSANAYAGSVTITDYATVTSAQPNYVTTHSREECTESYEQSASSRNDRGVMGPVIGGLAGGLIGSTVGKGSGKNVATGVGAITGAIVGDRMANQNQQTTTKVIRCHTVPGETRQSGYTVTVNYNGHQMSVFSNTPPRYGSRIPVTVRITVAESNDSWGY